MDPAVHRPLSEGPWIKAVREKTHNDRLFVYHHRGTGKFVVAEWLPSKPRVYGQGQAQCTELFVLSGPPDHFPDDLPTMEWVMDRCKPVQQMFDSWRGNRAKADYDKAVAEMESDEKRLSAAKWLKKQGLDEAAHTLGPGAAPYVGELQGGKENMEFVEEKLNDLVNSKLISTGGKEKKPSHKF